jgi:hypothetical protein
MGYTDDAVKIAKHYRIKHLKKNLDFYKLLARKHGYSVELDTRRGLLIIGNRKK